MIGGRREVDDWAGEILNELEIIRKRLWRIEMFAATALGALGANYAIIYFRTPLVTFIHAWIG